MHASVAIVGGGLSGLYAAWLLQCAGIDFHLYEARDRLGGRIHTTEDEFDLGPSWYWPATQQKLATLIGELGLESFPQNTTGDLVFERMVRETPHRYQGYAQEPRSMRLAGGTGALVKALAEKIPQERIHTGTQVQKVFLNNETVFLSLKDTFGEVTEVRTEKVILALPPRLIESSIYFHPSIESKTRDRWKNTPTWMAPHAKFYAVYDKPFWRNSGMSGTAQSMVGPLVEIHDATTASGKAALFGFVGLNADQRASVGEAELKKSCVDQLTRLFGVEAANTEQTILKDWSSDPLTSTIDDRFASGHPEANDLEWVDRYWKDWITLAGSETSSTEPGYLAGAIQAATRAATEIINKFKNNK